jgi:hypothetical protein
MYVQVPAWDTANVRFFIVIVPFLAPSLLAPIEYATEPLPLDDDPPVMLSHGTVLVAIQGQPAAAETAIAPLDAATPNEALAGAIESTVHADWLRATVIPPISILADREAESKSGATETPTEPLPVPLVPAVMVAHGLSEMALQEHPGDAETNTLGVPPAAVAGRLRGFTVILHD